LELIPGAKKIPKQNHGGFEACKKDSLKNGGYLS
jgi:hypothetical protein